MGETGGLRWESDMTHAGRGQAGLGAGDGEAAGNVLGLAPLRLAPDLWCCYGLALKGEGPRNRARGRRGSRLRNRQQVMLCAAIAFPRLSSCLRRNAEGRSELYSPTFQRPEAQN